MLAVMSTEEKYMDILHYKKCKDKQGQSVVRRTQLSLSRQSLQDLRPSRLPLSDPIYRRNGLTDNENRNIRDKAARYELKRSPLLEKDGQGNWIYTLSPRRVQRRKT